MEIPQEGKYVCKLNGQLVIYEASTGSLCAAVPCVMVAAPPAHAPTDAVGFTFKHTMVLVKADGTIQTKTTDTLKTVFGWDGLDPFWLMDNSEDNGALRAIEFEIVGGPETGDKGGLYFKSQWLNPLGGGLNSPVAANRESVLARYGNKFKALAATAPAPAAPAKPPVAMNNFPGGRTSQRNVPTAASKVPSVPPSRPPQGAPQGATMEEAWAALNQNNPGKDAADIEKLWFDTLSKLFPNKSNSDLKLHEWGKLKAEFEKDELPM